MTPPAGRGNDGVRLVLIALALLGSLVAAATAQAARPLTTGFADPLFTSGDAGVRDTWLTRSAQARAGIVRLNVHWAGIVGGPPAAPRNPADPAYDFGALDAAVRSATQHGFQVLLTVFDAPHWAEGRHRRSSAPAGTWKPRPGPYGDFGHALAERYSGSYPAVMSLPRVRYLQAWNEENLSNYLNPQWRHRRAVSPGHYRRMLNSFYAGVHSAVPGDQVVTGGTAPYGDPPGGSRMRPLRFLRGVLCVNGRHHLTRAGCKHKASFDVLAHHPINTSGGPHRSALNPDDATTPDMKHVVQLLRGAERLGQVRPRGRHPVWVTEFWWESDPPDRFRGVPPRRQARYIEDSLYLFWKAGVRTAINLQIRDSRYFPSNPLATVQSGLFFVNGSAKPSFRAFRFPFVTHRISKRRVRAWGKAPAGGPVQIQRRRHGHWNTIKTIRHGGVFSGPLRVRGHAALRATASGDKSLVWHQR